MSLPVVISGKVVHGNRIGRQLGFPTANLALGYREAVDGVYAVRVRIDGTVWNGVANIGVRPTVASGSERLLEVYLFDFDRDIYGQTIEVELVAYLRPERKFDSVETMRLQIERDKTDAEKALSECAAE